MHNDLIASQEDCTTKALIMTIAAEKSRLAPPRPTGRFHVARPRDLPSLTGLSRTTIWRLERAGDFPKRIRLSAGAVGYRMADIQAWLDSRQKVVED